MEKLLQFLDHNKFPLVTKLTELNSIRVYSSPIKLQVLFYENLIMPFLNLYFLYPALVYFHI